MGFDVTTKRKLRLPLSTVNTHFAAKSVFRSSQENGDFLSTYFSTREFDSAEEIFIVPFHNDDEITGLLCIAEATTSYDAQIEFLTSYIDSLSRFLFESRQLFYTKPTGSQHYSTNPGEETKSFIDKAEKENKHLIIIRLELGPIIEHLRSRLSDAESYRLQKDIISLTSSMIRGNGELVYPSPKHCFLLVLSNSMTQGQLLLHQLYNSLNTYFSLDKDPLPLLSSTERLYPRDGTTAEQLLNGLI